MNLFDSFLWFMLIAISFYTQYERIIIEQQIKSNDQITLDSFDYKCSVVTTHPLIPYDGFKKVNKNEH